MLFQYIVCFTGVWATIHKILRNIQKSADSAETQQNSSASNVNIFSTLNHSILANTIFQTSETRTFFQIHSINYYNIAIIADISIKMKKDAIFSQFKGDNSGRRHENQKNDPIFVTSSPNCLRNSFLHLKFVKIYFHAVSPLVRSGLQNTWILELKAVRLEFCPVWSRKHAHWEK